MRLSGDLGRELLSMKYINRVFFVKSMRRCQFSLTRGEQKIILHVAFMIAVTYSEHNAIN
jgi:hypothetical protein